MDPISGFDATTKIFHSIRGSVQLPPENAPLSATSYIFSRLPNPLPQNPAFIDATTSQTLSFPDLLSNVRNLSANLLSQIPALRSSPHPPAAFVLSTPSLQIPTLYLSLLSIGVAVSPSNPASTPAEIGRQISLSRPSVIFATSSTASKLPASFPHPIILLDSPKFRSMIATPPPSRPPAAAVMQSDPAAILYSSGTTGKFKGVVLTHRNLIAVTASSAAGRRWEEEPVSMLLTVPLFHVFGFYMCLAEVAAGETGVLLESFEFGAMLRAVVKYRVNYMPVSPPLVVALAKSEEVVKHDLSSLKALGCGGAPLGKDVAEKFKERFPDVDIAQVRR
ncbi:hypothetical protein ACLOJK_009109 [Asimina triloba]